LTRSVSLTISIFGLERPGCDRPVRKGTQLRVRFERDVQQSVAAPRIADLAAIETLELLDTWAVVKLATAGADNFDGLRDQVRAVTMSCVACHEKYRIKRKRGDLE
jgi:cytochrome c556